MTSLTVDNNLFQWMVSIRRHIHAHPELAFKECKTAAFICQKLDELGIPFTDSIGKTGIIATLGDHPAHDHCVAIRADMDALPIQEETGLAFSSLHDGIMHACGHDGHVAMLLGAAALLINTPLQGKVRLIFQPAEESGGGAEKMVNDGALKDVNAIIAGHIDHHLSIGSIAIQEGLICSYTDEFVIEISCKGGHAGKPHETADSIVIACSLVTALQTLVSRETNPSMPCVLSIGKIQGGDAPNVIANRTILAGTIRTTDSRVRQSLIQGMTRMVTATQNMYQATTSIRFEEGYPPVVNDPKITHIAQKSAQKIDGIKQVLGIPYPSMGGEDFSFYLRDIPGCFARFGALKYGNKGAAHSPHFDFDEQVIALGALFQAQTALDCLEHLNRKQETL